MSKRENNLMEEWRQLRLETINKQSFIERLIITTITGNFIIYSFALTLQNLAPVNALIALIPIFVTTMSYFWIIRNLYSGIRMIVYIVEKIEPVTGLGWENWLRTPRKSTQSDGKLKWFEDIFSLFYHMFFIFSPILSITLIWLPHWPYGNNLTSGSIGTQQLSPPTDMCFMLSIAVLVLSVIWYVIANLIFIGPRKKDIESLNRELIEVEIELFEDND